MDTAYDPGAARESSRGRAGVRGRRVLVVDDNPDIVESCSLLLMHLGYEVASAFDGDRALEVARDFRPDAALLDVGLPGIDGYELARRLRAEYGPQVLLIIITAYAPDNPHRVAYEAYFDHHFMKPFD